MEKELAQVGVVAGVVIKKDNKYLLVQEKQPAAFGLWNLPAGKVEIGDSIEETAIKEAKEETGYNVELLGKLGVFHENINKPVKHAFGAKIINGNLSWPEEEIIKAELFFLEEIVKMKNELRGEWVLEAIKKYEEIYNF